jgi:SWI/SNF-related matrix-associated actin-dependent regulator 1 of chromatin subfamily A
VKPKVLVIDEIHYLLGNSKRTRAVKSLSRITKHIIGISGTPSVNRARELYNPIKMIAPHLLPNKWMFQFAYCGPEHNGYGWKFEGASHTKELHGLLSQIMIRRKKKDVWKNAPPKIRSLVPIEIDNRKEYETCEENFVAWVMQNKKKIKSIEGLAGNKLEMLRQVAIRGKMKGVLRWIEDYLNVVDKLVVFAYHKETINKIFDCFKKRSVKIDGSIPTNKRLGIVQAFQTDPKINLLIGQTEAAGTGLNMTAAHNVAFVELPWSPGALDQCIDRIHRHGQTKACNIYLLLAMTTVDERSAKIIDRKRKDLSLVLDGKTVDNRSLIGELLEQFKKGAKRLHAKNGLQTL